MLVDSHCHLNILPESFGGPKQIIAEAAQAGVTHMMCIAIGPDQWSEVLHWADQWPQVYAAIGVHPCEPKTVSVTDQQLIDAASHPKVLAIGETGLDYHHFDADNEDMTWQADRFRQMIRVAKQLNKPIVIHTRHSTPDCLRILKEENAQTVGGIMHCFVEDWAIAEEAMALNFYISFSGIVTFKNAKSVQAVAEKIPLDRLLVETDAPYLAPVPYRGKPNHPAYTCHVAEHLAQLRGQSLAEMAEITTANFQRLFAKPLADAPFQQAR